MPWINNLKLMPKLLLTFGVLLLVMLLQGIVAYRGLHSLNNVTTELAGSRMESIRMAGEMRGMLGEYRNAAYQQLIRASDDVKSDARKQAVDLRTSMDTSIKEYPKLVDNAQQKKLFDTFAKEWKDALASYDSVTEMLELDLPDDAIDTFVGETRTKHRKAASALEALIAEDNRLARASRRGRVHLFRLRRADRDRPVGRRRARPGAGLAVRARPGRQRAWRRVGCQRRGRRQARWPHRRQPPG